MTLFDCKYQNPSGFAFLLIIRAIVIFTSLGIQNLNKKRKTNWVLVVVVKWHHRESYLLKGVASLWQSCLISGQMISTECASLFLFVGYSLL